MSFVRGFARGLRSIFRRPTEALPPVLILAIGIGLTTTLLSLIYGVLIRPLPFEGADSWLLVDTYVGSSADGETGVSPVVFGYWKEHAETVEKMSAYSMLMSFVRAGQGGTEASIAAEVDAELFELTGVRPIIGRLLSKRDQEVDAPAVAVIGFSMWQEHFDGAPNVQGASIVINGEPVTVVGVMPKGFAFPHSQQLWVPLKLDRQKSSFQKTLQAIVVPKASEQESRQELEVLTQRLARAAELEKAEGYRVRLQSFVAAQADNRLKDATPPMLLAVLAVFCVACLNVSGLLSARAIGESRHSAIRSALGAGAGDLMTFALGEALALSMIGALVGTLVAIPAVAAVNNFLGRGNLLNGFWAEARLDPALIAATVGLSILATLLAGALPAWRARSVEPIEALKSGSSGNSDSRTGFLADMLVVTEMALAVMVLVPAGLMFSSIWNLSQLDLGYETRDQMTAKVSVLDRSSNEAPSVFFQKLRRHLLLDQRVKEVAFSSNVPTEGTFWAEMIDESGNVPFSARWMIVSPEFFDTMGIPLLKGRCFSSTLDRSENPLRAVVSRSFAEQFLGLETASSDRSVLGSRIRWNADGKPWIETIGIVDDIIMDSTTNDKTLATLYLSMDQTPSPSMVAIVAGRDGIPSQESIRGGIAEVNPTAGSFDYRSIETLVQRRHWLYHSFAALFAIFAGISLILTLAGLYALMAATSRRRVQEFGIRLALGEEPRRLLLSILKMGLTRIVLGLSMGIIIALPTTRLIRHFTFGIDPMSPWNLLGVLALLSLCGLAASFAPARWAAQTDPQKALREG